MFMKEIGGCLFPVIMLKYQAVLFLDAMRFARVQEPHAAQRDITDMPVTG